MRKNWQKKGENLVSSKILWFLASVAISGTLRAGFFRSFSVDANAAYRYYQPTQDSCLTCPEAASSEIKIRRASAEEANLAEALIYGHLRSLYVPELDFSKGVMEAQTPWFSIPPQIPFDFAYRGRPCSVYDVKAVPFCVENEKTGGRLSEWLLAFHDEGRFRFAFYLNMNTMEISPSFKDGSLCVMFLSHLSTYPFLSEAEYEIQREFCMELQHGDLSRGLGAMHRSTEEELDAEMKRLDALARNLLESQPCDGGNAPSKSCAVTNAVEDGRR